MEIVRLLIVEEYSMVTEALTARLASVADFWVAGSCAAGDPRLPQLVRRLRPDVVLIDTEPLGFAAPEVLAGIKRERPDAAIVVVTADTDAARAIAAVRAGADAWVSKRQRMDDLEIVIRGVRIGESWFPPAMLGAILRSLRDDEHRTRGHGDDPLDVLSPRERDVLACMAEGRHGRQIAEELRISIDTVRTHTRSIFSKLDVHSRLEALSVARKAGLTAPARQDPT